VTEEQALLPRRTLGDYVMYQWPIHFSSIAIPTTAKALEINPDFFTFIDAYQFTTMEHEDHIHIWIHFMNWWEQWALNQMMLKMFVCAYFLFHWQVKLKGDSNHFQIRASLARKR